MSTLKLEQKAWLLGWQAFEVSPSDEFVRVRTKLWTTAREYQIPLNIIHRDSSRLRRFDVTGFVVVVVFAPLCLWMVYLALRYYPEWWVGVFLTFVLFFAGLRQFRRVGVDKQIFRSRINGHNLLILWHNNPTVQAYEAFTRDFQERLRNLDVVVSNPGMRSVADELRKLAELKKDGILTESEFNEVKAKLLGSLEQRKIGFN